MPKFTPLVNKVAKKDPTMQDPNCVWQLMKKHYARYTPELVSSVTGCPQDKLLEVYKIFAATGAPEKAGTILYAMGQTQHTYGSAERARHGRPAAPARQHRRRGRRHQRAPR